METTNKSLNILKPILKNRHEMILENKDFNNGNFDINFLGKFLKKIRGKKQ